ncbi:uncharacterized protein LOC126625633 [Malus sylvestris]|uniref:uncharacterized protein LOC126625633 n=1 Tax=Malus sylvestris TaxID=3752 RepID=UPI0021AC610A|nr:uncharacterized protein LOC126625633 [Malus sylvestris]
MIQSSHYYPQSNGQAESNNKILVNIIKRMVIDSPEMWHEKLGNTLWAYRTSKRAGIGTTLYALTFGQDVVLSMEINIQEGKKAVARAYNKKVKIKSFKEGDLVWKAVLPLGAQLRGFGKWSPTWEDCYIEEDAKCNGVSAGFPISSWIKSDQVIGLCGQDELGRGSSSRVITIHDGEA